jgi:adenine-specific DNA-methyltransferase
VAEKSVQQNGKGSGANPRLEQESLSSVDKLCGRRMEVTDAAISRRLRELRQIATTLKKTRRPPLECCRSIIKGRGVDPKTKVFFSGLPKEEKHYWISSLYALLMPATRRRKLAAYFTPPHLAKYSIQLLIAAGIQPGRDKILDPASGGAAFLVPLAAHIAEQLRKRGVSASQILDAIESTLAGVEIEPDLAKLSEALLTDLLHKEIQATGRKPKISITRADTLKLPVPDTLYDAIIGNPPYGRIFRPLKSVLKNFAPVVTDGYVNLYALFLEQSLRWVKPGGVISLIIPMSFLGGPYFASLRKRILETSHVLSLDPIDKRSDLFLDVLYDVCVLTLRKKPLTGRLDPATSRLLMIGQPHRPLGTLELPERANTHLWALPDGHAKQELFSAGLNTLRDYGFVAKTGYFVWNREQHRYRSGKNPRANEVPLFWAHNIRAGSSCKPSDRMPHSKNVAFVKVSAHSTAVVHCDAILLQRTTNKRQPRRLVAAVVRKSTLPGKCGFVSENHTIIVIPDPAQKQKISISLLCRLLNTAVVDARFRRISGSVSVSTKALNQLPLPAWEKVQAAFSANGDDEEAARVAYAASLEMRQQIAKFAVRAG